MTTAGAPFRQAAPFARVSLALCALEISIAVVIVSIAWTVHPVPSHLQAGLGCAWLLCSGVGLCLCVAGGFLDHDKKWSALALLALTFCFCLVATQMIV